MKALYWKTEPRRIDDLIPYGHNPRAMTEEENEKLVASVRKFGLVEIPVIDIDNVIVAGHQRIRVMQSLHRGEELTDVRVPSRKLTPEEFNEYLVRSNKNTGHWDMDVLANAFEVPDLLEWGFKPSELGIVGPDALNAENAELRFTFDTKTHEEVVERLKAVQEIFGTDTKEATLLRLLENAI